jgi:CheY-like chemotaxis protein
MYRKYPILVVEDSDEDFYTTARVLQKIGSFPVRRCANGSDVLLQLYQPTQTEQTGRVSPPSLILLDLNLPGKRDGRDVLVDLKSDNRFSHIPVVILTTSENPKDVRQCFENGAAGYMVKPVDLTKFIESMESMVKYWFEAVTLPSEQGEAL